MEHDRPCGGCLPWPDIDTSRPHPARMYDYYIGGKNHFAADRAVADAALASLARRADRAAGEPAVPRPGRQVPGRPRRESGSSSTSAPGCRPRATCTRSRRRSTRRAGWSTSTTTRWCSRTPGRCSPPRPRGAPPTSRPTCRSPLDILTSPVIRSVLDFGKPVALMLVAVLHFLAEEDKPEAVIATLLDALPSGSYLAASHVTMEHDPEGVGGGQRAYREAGLPMQRARRRRVRVARVLRPRAGAARRGAGLGVAAGHERAAADPGRGVLLRRGRPQAVRPRPPRDTRGVLALLAVIRRARGSSRCP